MIPVGAQISVVFFVILIILIGVTLGDFLTETSGIERLRVILLFVGWWLIGYILTIGLLYANQEFDNTEKTKSLIVVTQLSAIIIGLLGLLLIIPSIYFWPQWLYDKFECWKFDRSYRKSD